MAAPQDNSYTAKDIQVLEGLEPVRKRPGMYIGSTDINGLHELIKEIVDNSVDEALAGFAQNVWIVIDKDNEITVVDDGRGIPVEIHPKVKKSTLEVTMTMLHEIIKYMPSSTNGASRKQRSKLLPKQKFPILL